jgi:hypothetical protein
LSNVAVAVAVVKVAVGVAGGSVAVVGWQWQCGSGWRGGRSKNGGNWMSIEGDMDDRWRLRVAVAVAGWQWGRVAVTVDGWMGGSVAVDGGVAGRKVEGIG